MRSAVNATVLPTLKRVPILGGFARTVAQIHDVRVPDADD
jgi:hypothetical protein